MKNTSKYFALQILMSIILIYGCKKEEIIIHFDENQNLRINQVQFYDYGNENVFGYLKKRELIYSYDSISNNLNKIELNNYTKFDNEPPLLYIDMIQVTHDADQITFRHSSFGSESLIWSGAKIKTTSNGQVYQSLNHVTDMLIYIRPNNEIKINFNSDSASKFKSVVLDDGVYQHTYKPLQLKVKEYNSLGKIKSMESIMQLTEMDVLHSSARDTFVFQFEFEYQRAKDVPSLLKRMVNEELLQVNKYGVVNYEVATLSGNEYYKKLFVPEDHKGPVSNYGEGNWLVSFGMPQNYIIEHKSEYLVSKRTTHHYRILPSGEKEFIKSTVEEFPYIHDAEAKTLEIAGLKIWYEFVD